jgi:hypothetical protein
MDEYIAITIDSKYHRDQFDDWLAGGKIQYKNKRYYWSAQNNSYGLGWEIEPITDDNWSDISESELNEIIAIIRKCLQEHRTEYVF